MSKVYFVKIHPDAVIPQRTNPTDAGMDLYSVEDIEIPPNGGRRMVSTGLKIGISPDKVNSFVIEKKIEQGDTHFPYKVGEDFVWQAEVRPRSGLAAKQGITVLNTPGTIDNGYRGELKVIMVNHEVSPFKVSKGDRIAQLVFTKSYILPIEEVQEFPDETSRGEGGFGSSGN